MDTGWWYIVYNFDIMQKRVVYKGHNKYSYINGHTQVTVTLCKSMRLCQNIGKKYNNRNWLIIWSNVTVTFIGLILVGSDITHMV